MNELYLHNLTKTYASSKTQHDAPERKLSVYKRNLIKRGLPLHIKSADDEIVGVIYLNHNGEICVSYTKLTIDGKTMEVPTNSYLLDASNKIIEQCEPYIKHYHE